MATHGKNDGEEKANEDRPAVNPALVLELFTELQKAETKAGRRFDFKGACELYSNKLSGSDFEEMLWMAGLRYPFSPEVSVAVLALSL